MTQSINPYAPDYVAADPFTRAYTPPPQPTSPAVYPYTAPTPTYPTPTQQYSYPTPTAAPTPQPTSPAVYPYKAPTTQPVSIVPAPATYAPTPTYTPVPTKPTYYRTPTGKIGVYVPTEFKVVKSPKEAVRLASQLAEKRVEVPAVGALYKRTTSEGMEYMIEPVSVTRRRTRLAEAEREAEAWFAGATPLEKTLIGTTTLFTGAGWEYVTSFIPGGAKPEDVAKAQIARSKFLHKQYGPEGPFIAVVEAFGGSPLGTFATAATFGSIMEGLPTGGRTVRFIQKGLAGLYVAEKGRRGYEAIVRKDPEKFAEVLLRTGTEIYGFGVGRRWAREARTGLAPGEDIFQLQRTKTTTIGRGELDIKTGKVPFVAKTGKDVFAAGVSKEATYLGEGARVSLAKVGGKDFIGLGYEFTVPTGAEKVTAGMGFFEIKQITGVVPRPTGIWPTGYGIVPATEVTYEPSYVDIKSFTKLVGEPEVIAEWQVPSATWKDPTKEMMTLRSAFDVKSFATGTEGFAAIDGKATFDLTAQVIGIGGGGRAGYVAPPPTGFGFGAPLMMFDIPGWTKDIKVSDVTAVAKGRIAEAQIFKPEPTEELWSTTIIDTGLKQLEREGYIVKHKPPATLFKLDVGRAVRQAQKVELKTAHKQELKFDVAQEMELGKGLKRTTKQAQRQAQRQAQQLGLRLAPKFPGIKLGFEPVPFPFGMPLPKTELPSWPRRKPQRRRKRRQRKPRYKYTPTLVGMRQARYGGPLIRKAPKAVGIQAVGIRPPVGRKRKTAKKRKRRYEKNFLKALGL